MTDPENPNLKPQTHLRSRLVLSHRRLPKAPPHPFLPEHRLRGPLPLVRPHPLSLSTQLVLRRHQPMESWTLDYPPFFTHFERFLFLLQTRQPHLVDLHNGLNYKSPSVIIFWRLTVIVSDTVLIYEIYQLGKKLGSRERNLICFLVVWSPGLLIVDIMHFHMENILQKNGNLRIA